MIAHALTIAKLKILMKTSLAGGRMKILAGIFSLTLFAATLSVSFSSPAISKQAHKGKANANQTSQAKPTSNDKKPHCDQTSGANHNTPCY
jgi:hypothetical protein